MSRARHRNVTPMALAYSSIGQDFFDRPLTIVAGHLVDVATRSTSQIGAPGCIASLFAHLAILVTASGLRSLAPATAAAPCGPPEHMHECLPRLAEVPLELTPVHDTTYY